MRKNIGKKCSENNVDRLHCSMGFFLRSYTQQRTDKFEMCSCARARKLETFTCCQQISYNCLLRVCVPCTFQKTNKNINKTLLISLGGRTAENFNHCLYRMASHIHLSELCFSLVLLQAADFDTLSRDLLAAINLSTCRVLSQTVHLWGSCCQLFAPSNLE